MSDDKKPFQATPAATLEQYVMDARIEKSEAEWWASREIERLREQLHLANIDAVGAHAEANELRKHLIKAVALIIRLIDTRRCSASDLRALNAARAALNEVKP